MNDSRTEMTMQLLATMVATEIAKKQNKSKSEALNEFMKSNTAEILFDKETGLWSNGPDYIAYDYEKECIAKQSASL